MRSRFFVTLHLFVVAAFQAGSNAQTVTAGGVVNNAGFQAPVAPGSLIAIFGANLAAAPAAASGLPLPTTLGGVSVTVNGTLAVPLIYVSDKQINAQLPYETPVGSATLSVNGSAAVTFSVAASAPGILTYGTNRAVAINQDGTLNSPDQPARPGGWVTVYMSGQGLVSPSVASGAASPGNPAAQPMLPVAATIGKQSAGIMFAGLTPGAVGLFQVNLGIPRLASGDYPLIVSVGEAQSNAPLISVSADGSPVLSIVRTIAYHQVTNLPDQGPDYRTSFAISGFGGAIAFTHDSGPNQIYVMNFDGTGPTMVDSYQAQCACGSFVDISDKGDKVVSTEGRQIRLVDQGAAMSLLTIDSSTAGIAGLKIEGDGGRIFFLVDRDASIIGGAQSAGIQRGLYMMPVDGSGMVQIVGPDAVAALFGETASNYYTPGFSDSENAPNHTLGVSADGTRIVFGAQQVSGGGPDAIFGVNGDGSELHMILGPVPYLNHLGISTDGSKVLYDYTSSDFVVETGVIDFDGTNRLALRHDGLGVTPGVQLSADGSLLLANDILYNTDGSGTLQLSTLMNDLAPGNPLMDVTATHFVYPFVIPGTYSQGLSQLATAEINPKSLGAAPAISNPAINPDYAVAGGAVQGTVTAAVSPHDHVLGVNYALVQDGLVEDPVNGVIFLVDDGTSGDQVTGDGIFTCNNVIAQADAPAGPRLFRLFAEVTDAAGLRHGTLIDMTPFSVVLTPPASSAGR
jgi:uncharacterized protein (TIGR03437 family)